MNTINTHKEIIRENVMQESRIYDLSVLPNEVKEAYLDVTRHHRRLLERLAQR